MCAVVARRCGPVTALFEDEATLVSLPLFARTWGHVIVTPKRHVERLGSIAASEWAALGAFAHQAAAAIESALEPRRVFVAATGSAAGELTNCSVHVHLHVVPVFEPGDRPSEVFSWQSGVLRGDDAERTALAARLSAAWPPR
jgi:diadenosine tetraphosphate (Ap4A) HIT family hydrolase